MRRSALAALGALSFMGLAGAACGGGGSTGDNSSPSVNTGGAAGDTSSGASGQPGTGGSQSSDNDASMGSSGTMNAGGNTGTGGTTGAGGTSAPTDAAQVSDATCANATAFETFGVFVAPPSGNADGGDAAADAGACGTKANPCPTIQQGIDAAAKGTKQYVYVATGTYNEDGITLAKGVSLTGGWSPTDWTRGCPIDAGATTIRNVKGNKVITAVDLGGSGAIDSFTLKSKPQSAVGTTTSGDGESIYGIFAKGATTALSVANVKILLSDGGRGSNGGAAADPAAAPATPGMCPANTTPATMMGGNGSDGLGAVPAALGADGFVPSAGKNATAGLMGGDGASNPGQKSGTNSCGQCNPYKTATDGPSCTASFTYLTEQAGAGKQGCGGNGGGGGLGGLGGGSSIAIYASAAHVDILASQLLPGAGGSGGDGSSGKAGGAGAAGATGDPFYCIQSGTCCWGTFLTCGIIILPPVVTPAAVIGNPACGWGTTSYTLNGGTSTGGANGGTGGKGGGGAGGDSYAVVKVGGAVVTQGGGTTLSHGAVGPGGSGANMGAVGTAADIYE